MTIRVNGKEKTLENPLSVLQLLDQLGLDPERVAVELNRDIVVRAAFEATQVGEGDALEIVQFVGGG